MNRVCLVHSRYSETMFGRTDIAYCQMISSEHSTKRLVVNLQSADGIIDKIVKVKPVQNA